jgi:hypothetical protein
MKRVIRKALGMPVADSPRMASPIGLRTVYPDDTFIVSFPKSGNTWVRFLIASMQHPEVEINFRNIERYVPDIHKSRKAINGMPAPRIMKCHVPSFDSFPRFVYVLRDGRDAMLSFYHYAVGREWFSGSLEEFIASDEANRFGTWSEHVLGALTYVQAHSDRALLVRYENLVSNPFQETLRIADFCRLGVDEAIVRKAVARCRFERLQEVERRQGGEVEGADFRFFRSGVVGQWREHPAAGELDSFMDDAKAVLSLLGYLS